MANLIFVIFLCHRKKHFPVTMATLIWSFKTIIFCICITDVDYIKYAENYSYDVMLEGDKLL